MGARKNDLNHETKVLAQMLLAAPARAAERVQRLQQRLAFSDISEKSEGKPQHSEEPGGAAHRLKVIDSAGVRPEGIDVGDGKHVACRQMGGERWWRGWWWRWSW
jgi:hypothetical protein